MSRKTKKPQVGTQERLDKVTSLFDIPKETVIDVPIIHMIGMRDLSIENFLGIVEYGEQTIRLNTKDGILCICGKKLQAKSMTAETIKIKGCIESISFNQ
ncbi:MAG: YabP/YqfC family sporulation protein [Cellulosilyticaceae bacterium]